MSQRGFSFSCQSVWLVFLCTCSLWAAVDGSGLHQDEIRQTDPSASIRPGRGPSDREKYESIIRRSPDSASALAARGKLIGLYLQADQRTQADAETERLLARLSDRPAFMKVLHETGRAYRWQAKDPAKGRQLYNRWLETYRSDPNAYQVQCGVVKTYLEEHDVDRATSALDRFKELCQPQADVFHETDHLAGEFRRRNLPGPSVALCRWFMETYPEHKQADSLKIPLYASLIDVHLLNKDRSQADAALEKLMAQRSDTEALQAALSAAAASYCQNGKDPAKGRAIYTRWLERFGDSPSAFKARCGIVKTYLAETDLANAAAGAEGLLTHADPQPEIAAVVREVADAYGRKGRHAEAVPLYRAGISHCPKASDATYAQRSLACSLVELGDLDAGRAAAERLISDHASHPQIDRLVCNAADTFYNKDHHAQAEPFYRAGLKHWPDKAYAMYHRRGLACALIRQGNLEGGKAELETMLTAYAGRPELARLTREVADAYRYGYYYAEAAALYRQVIETWPATPDVEYAHRGLACALVRVTGAEAAVETILQRLLSDYQDSKKLGFHVFVIGEEYYRLGMKQIEAGQPEQARVHLEKAIATWQKNITRIDDAFHRAMAADYSAVACQALGRTEEAIAYYQQVLERWPDYTRRWHALSVLGVLYEEQVHRNKLSRKAADTKIRALYQELVSTCPQSPGAPAAEAWLNANNRSADVNSSK